MNQTVLLLLVSLAGYALTGLAPWSDSAEGQQLSDLAAQDEDRDGGSEET